MDISSVSGAYAGVKIIRDLISSLMGTKIEAVAKEKIDEAHAKLGTVQDVLFYLRDELASVQMENTDLRKKLHDKEDWQATIANYHLKQTEGGAVVYIFKGEPNHYACPNCVNKREIQILQDRRVVSGIFDCPGCGKRFPVGSRRR